MHVGGLGTRWQGGIFQGKAAVPLFLVFFIFIFIAGSP
jgi:hypothetical protein